MEWTYQKKENLKIAHVNNTEIEDCIVGSRKRQKTKNLGQKENMRWNWNKQQTYTSFTGIWILQMDIMFNFFFSWWHHMDDCLILETRDIMGEAD